jgi:phosphoglycolate phosphatase-like HAD superfamily hydrolase
MQTQAVIFDVDGTLVDSNEAHARAWVAAFAAEQIEVDEAAVRRAIGMGGDKLIPEVSDVDPESALGKRLSKRRGEAFSDRELAGIVPFPQVRALALRLVADGYKLAIASSAKDDELGPLLERAEIADLLVGTSSGDDVDASKPSPDIVQSALTQTGLLPGEAIMVGDTPYDVQAAQRAGVRTVAFTCGGWSAADLGGAIAVYADAADLLARYDASPFARGR